MHRRRFAPLSAQRITDVAKQYFSGQASAREDDGLDIRCEKTAGERGRFKRIAAPHAQPLIKCRWIVKDDVLLALWRSILVNERHRRFDQPFGQLNGIGDSRTGTDEDWVTAV